MTIFEKVNEGIKQAMLNKDKVRLEALRGMKKEFLEAMTAKGGSHDLEDDQALKIIAKLLKQREDSAKIYREAGREELAEAEERESEVLQSFMPEQLSEEKIREALHAIIEKLGATEMKDMGRVMGEATKVLGAQADGRTISNIVRELLTR